MTDTHPCESCSMPIETGRYCRYCVDASGELQPFEFDHYTDIFEHPFVPAFLLNGLLGMVIGSVVGLVEVVLAYELIARTDDRD